MLRSNPNTRSTVSHHHWPTALRLMLLATILILVISLLPTLSSFINTVTEPVILSFAQPETAAAVAQLNDKDPAVRDQGIQKLGHIGTVEATDQLMAFFKRDEYLVDNGLSTARALADSGSSEALQTLIQALRQSQQTKPPKGGGLHARLKDA